MGWDACLLEPNQWLRWIECHPGFAGYLQVAGSLLALVIAIAVPWYIHLRQDRTAREPHHRSIERLRGVLVTLLGYMQGLRTVAQDYLGEDGQGKDNVTEANRQDLAVGLRMMYQRILDTGSLLGPASDKADLENVELIQLLTRIRDRLKNETDQIGRERDFLRKTPTIPVVKGSLEYGRYLDDQVGLELDAALSLLRPKII